MENGNNNKTKYKLVKKIGEGSYGKVYLVESEIDKKNYVIKTIFIDQMKDQEIKDALLEAQIMQKLEHPNIINFKETFMMKKPKKSLCIVMDFADGGDLKQRISKQKKYFHENQIIDWFTQICLAIKHIHDRKILHRDLKSQNIFLDKNEMIKLGDFGIAKTLDYTMQKASTFIGTPYYLSPEIVQNQSYSFKSDIWSLGVLLYEMCALKMPYEGSSMADLILKIVKGTHSSIPNCYSKDLKNLVNSLLSYDQNKRPSIHDILRLPIIKSRIKSFLTELEYSEEFSHTILHHYNPNARRISAPVKPKNVEKKEDLHHNHVNNHDSSYHSIHTQHEHKNSINHNINHSNSKEHNLGHLSDSKNHNQDKSNLVINSHRSTNDQQSSIDSSRHESNQKSVHNDENLYHKPLKNEKYGSNKNLVHNDVINNNTPVYSKIIVNHAKINENPIHPSHKDIINNEISHPKASDKHLSSKDIIIHNNSNHDHIKNHQAHKETPYNASHHNSINQHLNHEPMNKNQSHQILHTSSEKIKTNSEIHESNVHEEFHNKLGEYIRNFKKNPLHSHESQDNSTERGHRINIYNGHKLLVELQKIHNDEYDHHDNSTNESFELMKNTLKMNLKTESDDDKIEHHESQNESRIESDLETPTDSDYNKFEELKKEIISELGEPLFTKTFQIIEETMPTDTFIYDHEKISKALIKLSANFEISKILVAIDKISDIYSLVVREREKAFSKKK